MSFDPAEKADARGRAVVRASSRLASNPKLLVKAAQFPPIWSRWQCPSQPTTLTPLSPNSAPRSNHRSTALSSRPPILPWEHAPVPVLRIGFWPRCSANFSTRRLKPQTDMRHVTSAVASPPIYRRLPRTASAVAALRKVDGCEDGGGDPWDTGVAGKLSRTARPRRRTFSDWLAMRLIALD